MRIRVLFAVVALVLSLPARADSVEATIREFFVAYVSGDISRASAQWDGELPNKVALTMRVRCMRLDALRLAPQQVGDDTAIVEVEADITSSSAVEHPHPHQDSERRIIHLRRADTDWKITRWSRAEEEISARYDSLDAVRRAELLRSLPRTPAMVMDLVRLSVLHTNRAERTEARRLAELAEEIAFETGSVRAIAAALEVRAVLERHPPYGDIEASAISATESLLFAEASGDADAIATALLRLGRAAPKHDATTRALFRRVLSLADRLTDLSIAARAATQLAEDFAKEERFRDDLTYGQLALRYAEASGDAAALLSAQMNLAGAYMGQNDHSLGAFHAERAQRMAHELDFPGAEAFMLNHLHKHAAHYGHNEKAWAYAEQALALYRDRVCSPPAVADFLFERAYGHIFEDDYASANRNLQQGFREVAAGAPYTDTQYYLGMFVYAQMLFQMGKDEEALDVARRSGQGRARILSAYALTRLGRPDEARDVLRSLVDDLEHGRANLFGGESQHALFFNTSTDAYIELTNNLLDAGDVEEAFRVVQRFKGRFLREVLAHGDASEGPADAEEQRLAKSITQLNVALLAAKEPERVSAIRDELARVRLEFQDASNRRRISPPKLLSSSEVSSHRDLAKVLDRAVVLDYVVGRSRTFVFAARLDADGSPRLTAHVVPIERPKLEAAVLELRSALEQRNLRYGALSTDLYDLLVAPVEDVIAGAPLVCVIPNGNLWSLPLHALRDSRGRYLAEKAPVIYAPSVAVLAEMIDRDRTPGEGKPRTLLAFANPNIRAATVAQARAFHDRADLGAIPEAEEEVRELARLYGSRRSRVYIGDQARESVLKREAGSSDVLHIASHGLIDNEAPMFSALVLSKAPEEESEDGLLEAREITGLRPGTRIAVLSACETGRGQITTGDGVIGLSWALLAAGCPTAVVSQWKAVSATTATLMVDFHRNLLRGTDAAVALQKAQLALMSNERFSHPFYWAPFVVVGAP